MFDAILEGPYSWVVWVGVIAACIIFLAIFLFGLALLDDWMHRKVDINFFLPRKGKKP